MDFDAPLETGESQLPVADMLDDEGDEIDFKNWSEGGNPLCDAVVVVAGPDARGLWYTITVKGGFSKLD